MAVHSCSLELSPSSFLVRRSGVAFPVFRSAHLSGWRLPGVMNWLAVSLAIGSLIRFYIRHDTFIANIAVGPYLILFTLSGFVSLFSDIVFSVDRKRPHQCDERIVHSPC